MNTPCDSRSIKLQDAAIVTSKSDTDEARTSPSRVMSAGNLLTERFERQCSTGCSSIKDERSGGAGFRVFQQEASTGSTADITFSSTTLYTKKDLISKALVVVDQQESTPCGYFRGNHVVDEEDEHSVQSIERILCPRAASFTAANKRRGGRWDTNLMEGSMPGLVSFCHGSFASEGLMNGSSFLADDDSVSSLECSLLNSQHSKLTQNQDPAVGEKNSNQSSRFGARQENSRDSKHLNNVLEPQARIETNSHHQEVRWGEGSINCSSDTLPTISRRRAGQGWD